MNPLAAPDLMIAEEIPIDPAGRQAPRDTGAKDDPADEQQEPQDQAFAPFLTSHFSLLTFYATHSALGPAFMPG